ncbi:baeRF6 domain-containing protein [Enterococcus sp. AZ126]|uniref:baeRF6 domain-containing protein n=1 Tax=Enterococcus sp. AZ126 TaxID=2774635 RepID=UPI003F2499CA
MLDQEKDNLSVLFSDEVQGPFVTFILNTHVAHQDVEKDSLALKNFAKAAKVRFEKKYVEHSFAPFQEKIDALLADSSFWRNATKSVSIIISENDIFIHRLHVPVDNQYYVDDRPYLLGIIKNNQFNYRYYLMALNRDSMALYLVENNQVKSVDLPADAPTDLVGTLGDELTGGSMNYSIQGGAGYNGSSKEGVAYHGVNTKDEEVKIDWTNYYQAIDNYLKDTFVNSDNLPIRLYALPENQTLFKKIAKNPYLVSDACVSSSPAQVSFKDIEKGAQKINQELETIETKAYNQLLDKKFVDQLDDIVPASDEGKISHFFISTANFVNETTEMSTEEFDRRKVLNKVTDTVLRTGGKVFVLDQTASPDEKTLLAVLRY